MQNNDLNKALNFLEKRSFNSKHIKPGDSKYVGNLCSLNEVKNILEMIDKNTLSDFIVNLEKATPHKNLTDRKERKPVRVSTDRPFTHW